MRVLTIVGDLGIGGTQRVAQNLSIGLAARGAEVAVLAWGGGGPREEACRTAGLEVFAPAFETMTAESAVLEAARRWNPDIIHIHRTGYANPEETRILRYLSSRRVKTVETNVFARFDWSDGGRYIDAHCLLSKWCAYKWNAWGGRAASLKRSYILPNAVDCQSIVPIAGAERQLTRSRLGIPPERFIFGRVGQPMNPKWSPAIFDVFEKVLAQHDIGLLLVGAPPQIVAKSCLLPENVQARIVNVPLTLSDERLSALIGAMDGFLHMSAIGESFGMVLCEAMLSGIPVVTLSTPFRDNSQLEVVGHEKGGLIALTLDAVPLAMQRLMRDTSLRQAVKSGGHNWVHDRFGVDVVSRKALQIYQELLSNTPLPSQHQDAADAPPDREWLADMLSNGIGKSGGRRVRLMLRLLHDPVLYRAYLASRFWK